jgi:SAM-dependent methyltransferase
MSDNLAHRTECRLCGSRSLQLVLPILPSPIGDAFVTKEQLGEKQDLYPLDCYLCDDCGHLQNLDIVNPDVLFREYTYKTSVSLGLVEHFRRYAASSVAELKVAPGSLVVEMGSNDGSLLRAFKSLGMRVVGVDPAREVAAFAAANGIPTLPEFFDRDIAASIRAAHGPATVFCANNVFAHIDDISEVTSGISSLLSDDGVFIFEVSYIVDMIDSMVFDTIYHEHVSHHSLIPLERFFLKHDLTIFDVARVPTKGGSIRVFAQRLSTGARPRSANYARLVEEEVRRGIVKPAIYQQWFEKIEVRKRAVLNYIDSARAAGKKIVGYGASTTTTTLLYHFELENRIDYIVDDNPVKHGMFSPGAHIPVRPSDALLDDGVDIAIILAWIYAQPIMERNRAFLDKGGVFLVPLPEMQVVGQTG